DDVAVGEWTQRKQVGNVRIVCTRDNNCVVRRGIAYGTGDACLDAGPSITIVDFRLIENLKEDEIGIAVCIMRGQPAPEHCEAIDRIVAVAQPLLEIVFGVKIDLHGQTVGERSIDSAIETAYEFGTHAFGCTRI